MVTMEKYFTYTVNIVFIITGIYSACIGCLYFFYYHTLDSFISKIVWIVPLTLMCLGCLLIILGVFGCSGTPFRFEYLAIVLALIIIFAEVGLGIFWIMMWPNYPSYVKTPFDPVIAPYISVEESKARIKIHFMLNCCGRRGPMDFENVPGGIPVECCPELNDMSNRANSTCSLENAIPLGCNTILVSKIKTDAYVIIISSLLSGIIKFVVLMSGFVVGHAEMERQRRDDSDYDSSVYEHRPRPRRNNALRKFASGFKRGLDEAFN